MLKCTDRQNCGRFAAQQNASITFYFIFQNIILIYIQQFEVFASGTSRFGDEKQEKRGGAAPLKKRGEKPKRRSGAFSAICYVRGYKRLGQKPRITSQSRA